MLSLSEAPILIPERAACPSPEDIELYDDDAGSYFSVILEQQYEDQESPILFRPLPLRPREFKALEDERPSFVCPHSPQGISIPTANDEFSSSSSWKNSRYFPDREHGARNPSPILIRQATDDVSPLSSSDESSPTSSISIVKPVPMKVTTTSYSTDCISLLGDESCESATTAPTVMMISSSSSRNTEQESSNKSHDDDTSTLIRPVALTVQEAAREDLLCALSIAGGDACAENVQHCVSVLQSHYQRSNVDVRRRSVFDKEEGTWLTLTKPIYQDCLGSNDQGDPLYTLGRMSFDMFGPTELVCSLQGTFNTIHAVENQSVLPDALKYKGSLLRSYNVAAFTIMPASPAYPSNKNVYGPIRGIMTTTGFILADKTTPNRHSVWITGGSMEPNDSETDQAAWKRLFGHTTAESSFTTAAKNLACKLLRGGGGAETYRSDDDMMQQYTFNTPVGGHDKVYIDTLYLDDSLRIIRGHRGSIFVLSKLSHV